MFTLVIGGSASGKSEYAERLVRETGPGPKYYIATMTAGDEESLRRIEKHRARRADDGFQTVERGRNLAGVQLPEQGAVLLEDLGNLTANELFAPDGVTDADAAEKAVLLGVESLIAQSRDLVVVTNEVFSDGTKWEGKTLAYLRLLGRLNCGLAAMAGRVCEVVCGVPQYLKDGNDGMEKQGCKGKELTL